MFLDLEDLETNNLVGKRLFVEGPTSFLESFLEQVMKRLVIFFNAIEKGTELTEGTQSTLLQLIRWCAKHNGLNGEFTTIDGNVFWIGSPVSDTAAIEKFVGDADENLRACVVDKNQTDPAALRVVFDDIDW